MKLGLESYSTRNSRRTPVEVLELASELGLAGVLFELSPFDSFHDAELERIRQKAAEEDLYVEFGMGSIFRWHPMAEKGLELLTDAGYDVDGSDAQVVIHHLAIARKLGSPILRCVAGNLFTRDEGHDMAALADQAVVTLREASKAAEDMGLKIAIENHADFTVRELIGILGRVNSPALGFTVDCANLAFDLDAPLRLAEIMAPYALTTHFKDYRVIRTPKGLALENCAVGDGEIDLAAIAGVLSEHHPEIRLNIEIHSQFAPFTLDVLDPAFFDRHPSPPGDGLAWYLEKSWKKDVLEQRPADLPDGEESWRLELEHLKRSIAWAKEKLGSLLSV
ncbi:MAG: sugar phosphate isomerase/epimerase family protein [Planctomycetota bacterium]|jgi:sugar phosphate isomerase/epimerase